MSKVENLDKLADQIYKEGIEKASQESERILEEAKAKAQQLVQQAKQEADSVLQNAKKEALRLEESTRNEIRVKSNQAISDLREKIKSGILDQELSQSLKKDFEDQSFIRDLILQATENWSKTDKLEVIISPEMEQQVASFILDSVKDKLPGLTIQADKEVNEGFVVRHSKEGYYIAFTPQNFESFFRPYLSKTTGSILFNQDG